MTDHTTTGKSSTAEADGSSGSNSQRTETDTKSSAAESQGQIPKSIEELHSFLKNWDSSKNNTITISHTDVLPSNFKESIGMGVQFAVVDGCVQATFPMGTKIMNRGVPSSGQFYCMFVLGYREYGTGTFVVAKHDIIGSLQGDTSKSRLDWIR